MLALVPAASLHNREVICVVLRALVCDDGLEVPRGHSSVECLENPVAIVLHYRKEGRWVEGKEGSVTL